MHISHITSNVGIKTKYFSKSKFYSKNNRTVFFSLSQCNTKYFTNYLHFVKISNMKIVHIVTKIFFVNNLYKKTNSYFNLRLKSQLFRYLLAQSIRALIVELAFSFDLVALSVNKSKIRKDKKR